VPVGNAILTVENEAQAMARAKGGRAGKGGDAARACLDLVTMAVEARGGRA
jgi:6,7-dimethyl-8-ribityllumazine synthase